MKISEKEHFITETFKKRLREVCKKIDPQNEKALLYSSTYWKEIDPLTGLPTSYEDRNVNDVPSASKPNGMLIDLTTP